MFLDIDLSGKAAATSRQFPPHRHLPVCMFTAIESALQQRDGPLGESVGLGLGIQIKV